MPTDRLIISTLKYSTVRLYPLNRESRRVVSFNEFAMKLCTIAGLHAAYFPEKEDIAFTVWNLWVLAGFAIQYGWSTSVCVRDKIYIQIGILCFAMICYRKKF